MLQGTDLPIMEAAGSVQQASSAEEERGPEEPEVTAAFAALETSLAGRLSAEDQDLVRRAYETARRLHRGQVRASGEPYILHPIEVARILADYVPEGPTLAAAILHDTVEDTGISLEELSERFSSEVATLVDGVTKLTSLSVRQGRDSPAIPRSKQAARAENLRKIFLAMARDLRVILIKLADRLHNMRTLGCLRPEKQRVIAEETLEIFCPIASRLGIWELKWELEDLAFKYLYPDEYAELSEAVGEIRARREGAIQEALAALRQKLQEHGIAARLEWRVKHLYSIFQKVRRTGRTVEEIYDLLAIRVIVDSVPDCYTVLGAVHSLWIPFKDRIKDYIAKPKPNNYRSLHTTVLGPGAQPIEIQIRTHEMHSVNEMGIAAHWSYKEGRRPGKEAALFKEVYPWIRAILDWQADSSDAQEYVENLKLDLLSDQVFVFTPKGDVIDLPAHSTPIDFAYRIHTEVGHTCVGARVNGRMVPLNYELNNADIVEIQTSKSGTPSRDWLRIVKSPHARSKIKYWFKKERREENIARGTQLLRKELSRLRLESLLNDQDLMQRLAEKMNFANFEELVASLGYGETNLPKVIARLRDLVPEQVSQELLPTSERRRRKFPKGQLVYVKGIDNILTRLSRCCAPVPGDAITGYISLGKGVTVHRVDCPNFRHQAEATPERVIEVEWTAASADGPRHRVDLDIEANDRNGLVGDILEVINDSKVPVRAQTAVVKKERAHVRVALEILHRKQLEDLMKRLRKVRDVLDVSRTTHMAGPA